MSGRRIGTYSYGGSRAAVGDWGCGAGYLCAGRRGRRPAPRFFYGWDESVKNIPYDGRFTFVRGSATRRRPAGTGPADAPPGSTAIRSPSRT